MSLFSLESDALTQRFPRVSGDEPTQCVGYCRQILFSPRERG